MKRFVSIGIVIITLCCINHTYAQNYTPMAISSGFNNDGIAESGTNAMAVTSTGLDILEKVLYSVNFASTNTISGGIPNNGQIANGIHAYQLGDYTSNNCAYLSSGGSATNTSASATLVFTDPDSIAKISLLAFSTEGTSSISVTFNFEDGSTQNAGTYSLTDWFVGTTNIVVQNLGRVPRTSTGPYTPEFGSGSTANSPRFFYLDLLVSCANQAKKMVSVTITHASSSTTPRAVILAVSAIKYIPITAIVPTITPATCGSANGKIALSVTGGATPLTYLWNTVPPQTTATASNLAANSYTCTIKDVNGCATTYTGVVTQVSTASINITATPSTPICSGQSVDLAATGSGGTVSGYTWNPGSLTGSNVTVSPATNTTYTVSAQDANGCPLTKTIAVTVKPTPTSTFDITPVTLCKGTTNTITFTGTAGSTATYNWNSFDGAAIQSGSGSGPYTILFNTAGTHNIQLQVTDNGCTSTVTSHAVTVTNPPTTTFTVSPQAICSGQTVNIAYTGNATTTATTTWDMAGGYPQSGTGWGPYVVRYETTSNVNVTVTDGPCTVTGTPKTITVTPMPVAAFAADTLTGCEPFTVNFSNNSTNGVTYTWTFGDLTTSSSVTPPPHVYNTPGTYDVKLKAVQGMCSNESPIQTVTVKKQPIANFTATPWINTPIQLSFADFSFSNNSQYATNYFWTFGDGDTSSLISPVHTYHDPGAYTVKLYALNEIGCIDSIDYKPFVVIPDSVLKIPNAFSPNGDGINDTWIIEGLKGYPDAHVDIFNRWGQPVFNSLGYSIPWDGRYKGKLLPVGTFYYVINANKKTYSGWVVLLK